MAFAAPCPQLSENVPAWPAGQRTTKPLSVLAAMTTSPKKSARRRTSKAVAPARAASWTSRKMFPFSEPMSAPPSDPLGGFGVLGLAFDACDQAPQVRLVQLEGAQLGLRASRQ